MQRSGIGDARFESSTGNVAERLNMTPPVSRASHEDTRGLQAGGRVASHHATVSADDFVDNLGSLTTGQVWPNCGTRSELPLLPVRHLGSHPLLKALKAIDWVHCALRVEWDVLAAKTWLHGEGYANHSRFGSVSPCRYACYGSANGLFQVGDV